MASGFIRALTALVLLTLSMWLCQYTPYALGGVIIGALCGLDLCAEWFGWFECR